MVYGALRVGDGQERTLTAPSRNTAGWKRLLQAIERANPTGDLYVISDNLSSHDSRALRAWLADHPRIRQGFIPKRACWLHLQAGWWRLFRRAALAGRSLPTPVSSSTPRGWPPASSTGALGRGVGPSAPPTRKLRRKFVYRL